MVNEFIEKVVVHERKAKWQAESAQDIEIYFNFIGEYQLDEVELSEEEKEELAKKEERRKRLHENYLRRKANGKQEEYEKRYKERRKQIKQEKLSTLKRSGIALEDYTGEAYKVKRSTYVGST